MNQTSLPSSCSRTGQRYLSQGLRSIPAIFLAVGLLNLTVTNSAMAQEKLLRTLTVTGHGVERIPTTATQVQLGVEIQGESATGVQQEVAKRSSNVVELLRSRNVEKLQTTGIRLNPIYNYDSKVQRLTGYSAANTVSFRTSTEQAGKLLDDAVKAGATQINSVSFTASDSAIAEAQTQALRKATQEAQQQADAVLSVLNLTRKDVVNIQVEGATPPPPMPFLAKSAASNAGEIAIAADTPVIGSEQQVQASVTLQISY
jgi:uncharacterized protein